MSYRNFVGAAAIAVAIGCVTPAEAIKINLNYTGTSAEALQGFKIASGFWEKVLVNDSQVNLNVGFGVLGANVLGSTSSTKADVALRDVVKGLTTHATSDLDYTAVSNIGMKSNGSVDAVTNTAYFSDGTGVDTTKFEYDTDGSQNNSYIYGNTSNLKALGLTTDIRGANFANAVDGSVTFSSQYNFDFHPEDGISSNAIDFIGVAIHEIGHALGFTSGVDLYDIYGNPNGPYKSQADSGFDFDNPDGGLMTTLDLFRYSTDATNVSGKDYVRDWSVQNAAVIAAGGNSYFSIDGGATQLFGDSLFSTGRYNGDGQQASHWKDNVAGQPQEGVMDPTVAYGQQDVVKSLDLAAFDAMGYQISYDVLADPNRQFSTADIPWFVTGVPEAGTWAQMIAGFGLVGGMVRRRKARAAFA